MAHTLDVSWESATNVVPPEGTFASSEASEGESRSARTSIIDCGEQGIVNTACFTT